ncbi:hypothetical protein BVRB_017750, partial [Beta vulgaris subsp. vulgaris]
GPPSNPNQISSFLNYHHSPAYHLPQTLTLTLKPAPPPTTAQHRRKHQRLAVCFTQVHENISGWPKIVTSHHLHEVRQAGLEEVSSSPIEGSSNPSSKEQEPTLGTQTLRIQSS